MVTNQYTTGQLVEALKHRDLQAMEYLYDYFAKALYSCILRELPREEEAERVLEKAFLSVWCNIHAYPPGDRFFTWVIRTAQAEIASLLLLKRERQKKVDKALEALFCRPFPRAVEPGLVSA